MNKVRVFIAGKGYVLQTNEQEKYVVDLAKQVDKGIKELMQSDASLSLPSACILFAMDLMDQKAKSGANSDNLRFQIKDYIDEAAAANQKVEEMMKQLETLENEKKALENELQIYSLKEKLDKK